MPELTVGILGLGDIGGQIAKSCKDLGMTVWGFGRREQENVPSSVHQYRTKQNLPELLQACDFVCNVLPSTPSTKYFLSGNTFECCKVKKPVFINVGRGDVIDEKSLIHALEQGWLAGAVLDVFENEPLPKDSPLWDMPQVVITPHIASLSYPHEVHNNDNNDNNYNYNYNYNNNSNNGIRLMVNFGEVNLSATSKCFL